MAEIQKLRANGKDVRVLFDTWTDFLDFTNGAPSPAWQGTRHSHDSREHFHGTKTFTEAAQLARLGWPEGRQKIVSGVELAARMAPTVGPARGYDVAGAFPDIARAVAGVPDCMLTPEPAETAARHVLRVVVSCAIYHGVPASDIMNRGVAILSAIDAAENAGHSVEILLSFSVGKDGQTFDALIPLKKAGTHWDADRMAYALAHPSLLRRHCFALLERFDETSTMRGGYGVPANCPADWQPARTVYFPKVTAGNAGNFTTLGGALAVARARIEAALSGTDTEQPEDVPAPEGWKPVPPPSGEPAPPKKMFARFPGRCRCGERFAKGEIIHYDKQNSRVAKCLKCQG